MQSRKTQLTTYRNITRHIHTIIGRTDTENWIFRILWQSKQYKIIKLYKKNKRKKPKTHTHNEEIGYVKHKQRAIQTKLHIRRGYESQVNKKSNSEK